MRLKNLIIFIHFGGKLKVIDLLKRVKMPKDVVDFYKVNNRLYEEILLSEEEKVKKFCELLRCLSNPIRLKLLFLLKRPHCVCVLASVLNTDITLISHHLAKLKECNLVRVSPQARARIYEVNHEALKQLIFELIEFLKSD